MKNVESGPSLEVEPKFETKIESGEEEREYNDFVPLANLLNEAQKHPQSRGAEFV